MPANKVKSGQTPSKFRKTKGVSSLLTKCSLAIIPVFGTSYVMHLPEYLGIVIYAEQYVGAFLTFLLTSTFLLVPPTASATRTRVPWYDALFAAFGLISGGYVAVFYPSIVTEIGFLVPGRILLGAILIILVLEATRRLVGWPLVIVGGIFVLYAGLAFLLPGLFHARMIPYGRIVTYLYLSSDGILGIALRTGGIIVFGFIFFGHALFFIGAGQFLTDIAMALMGRYRGGPAKVAIVASSMFGSISGSASANVVMTGIVTIPIMKRIGYKPHTAAAIEAVASTGGLVLPPIMAATAFIISEFLEIPYSEVAYAALVPAVLYYVAVFVQVHLMAVRDGLKGLPSDELPSLKRVLAKGWFYFIPIAILVYGLFGINMTAETVAIYSVGATIIVGLFKKEVREHIRKDPLGLLVGTGMGLLEIGIICATAGMVIGSISLTGLALSLSNSLVSISGGNVLILLFLSAGCAIILGMGMPITAVYLMLVVFIAPALIKLGVVPIAAHLFIMYFGAMSFLTPPVAIAAYVAAGIARADPMRTGFAGVRLGIAAYIVPFVFALDSGLILVGSMSHIVLTVGTALLGILFLAVAIEGYLFRTLGIFQRVILGVGACCLVAPNLVSSIIGTGMVFSVFIWELSRKLRVKGNDSSHSVESTE